MGDSENKEQDDWGPEGEELSVEDIAVTTKNKSDVSDMLKEFGSPLGDDGEDEGELPPAEDEESEEKEEKKEESKEEDTEEGEEEGLESLGEEVGKGVEKVETEEESSESGETEREDPRGKELEELREQLKQRDQELLSVRRQQEIEKLKSNDLKEFITEEEFAAIFTDPKTFNEKLNKVYQTVRERILLDMPNVVSSQISLQTAVRERANRFYSENPELRNHAEYVQHVIQKVEDKNPDWGFEKVLSEAEKEVRNVLKVPKKAVVQKGGTQKGGTNIKREGRKGPPIPPTSSSRSGRKGESSETQKELAALMKGVRR